MFSRTFCVLALVAAANGKNLRSNPSLIDNKHFVSKNLDKFIWESTFNPGIVDTNTTVFNYEKKIETIENKKAKEYCKTIPLIQDNKQALNECSMIRYTTGAEYLNFEKSTKSNETIFINEVSIFSKANEDEQITSIGYVYITGYTRFNKLNDKDGNERLPTEDELIKAFMYMNQMKGLKFIPIDY